MRVTPVRPMVRGDLEAVLAIEAGANPMPWREGHFLPFVQAAPLPGLPEPVERKPGRAGQRVEAVNMAWVFGASGDRPEAGRPVLGFACAAAVADEVELQSIAVEADSRGRGIGTALLEALVEWAHEAGYRTLHLEVRAGNAPALALYRRFGFAQVGIRRGYYQDNGEDALLLTREIQRAGAAQPGRPSAPQDF